MTDQTAVWIDGDPLMEAIAADVWAQCERHDSGLIVDDPRNIAAVAAAAVARAHAAAVRAPATDEAALGFVSNPQTGYGQATGGNTPPVQSTGQAALRDRIAEALEQADYRPDMRRGDLADAIMPVLPAPADRAAVLREAADIAEEQRQFEPAFGARKSAQVSENVGILRVAAELRRLADETQQPVSTAPLAAGLPLVKGNCPACGTAGLFLGDGGYVTCSLIDCPEPDAASTLLERRLAAESAPADTPAEDPARIDRIRPEFTEHSSVEAIDIQLQRARSQQRRWHLRAEWLISLRQRRVDQKARGEWPAASDAAAQQPKEARS